jgi:hypothetical protein
VLDLRQALVGVVRERRRDLAPVALGVLHVRRLLLDEAPQQLVVVAWRGPGVTVDAPLPRLSSAIGRRAQASRSASGAQSLAIAGMPGTSSSGAPDPRLS